MKQVGFWYSKEEPHFPRAQDFIDPQWEPFQREAVLAHLRQGTIQTRYRGMSACRICAHSNGSQTMTDGTYNWPQGFEHYITEHGVRPPTEFIAHCLNLSNAPSGTRTEVETALVDLVDGHSAYDLVDSTGLTLDRCKEIRSIYERLVDKADLFRLVDMKRNEHR